MILACAIQELFVLGPYPIAQALGTLIVQPASVTPSVPRTSSPSTAPESSDPRRARILAVSIYRELRSGGMSEQEVVAIATELLSQVATDLKAARES